MSHCSLSICILQKSYKIALKSFNLAKRWQNICTRNKNRINKQHVAINIEKKAKISQISLMLAKQRYIVVIQEYSTSQKS